MNGNFIKWVIVIFTGIVLGLGAWNLSETAAAKSMSANHEARLVILEEALRESRQDQKEIKDALFELKLLILRREETRP